MGKEALVFAEVGVEAGEVRAFLESHELILRGELRRRIAIPEIRNLRIDGDDLTFSSGGEAVRLRLGAQMASRWMTSIEAPPTDLKTKLGIRVGCRVFCLGAFDDETLKRSIAGHEAIDLLSATMLVAYVEAAVDIETALTTHAKHPTLPLWVVYRKGRTVAFGDTAIRSRLRQAGLRDSKSCSVSDFLTATRYSYPAV
jgi:hypothetical protein